jgi:hypothetical protein
MTRSSLILKAALFCFLVGLGAFADDRTKALSIGPVDQGGALGGTGPSSGVAAYDAGNRTIHVVLIGLERDPTIGDGVTASAAKLRGMLEATFSKNIVFTHVGFSSVGLRELGKEYFTQATMDVVFNELKSGPNLVKPDDVIFCFVMTHGAYDESQPRQMDPTNAYEIHENYHVLQQHDGGLYKRVNLMESFVALKPRLTVLITDSCNVPLGIQNPGISPASLGTSKAIKGLLLDYEGQVDFNSSSVGQYSFYYPTGGIFSDAFTALANHSGEFTWGQFFTTLSDFSNQTFQTKVPGGYVDLFGKIPGGVQKNLRPLQLRPLGSDKFLRKLP